MNYAPSKPTLEQQLDALDKRAAALLKDYQRLAAQIDRADTDTARAKLRAKAEIALAARDEVALLAGAARRAITRLRRVEAVKQILAAALVEADEEVKRLMLLDVTAADGELTPPPPIDLKTLRIGIDLGGLLEVEDARRPKRRSK